MKVFPLIYSHLETPFMEVFSLIYLHLETPIVINIWQADFFSEELDSYTKGQKGQVKERKRKKLRNNLLKARNPERKLLQ